MTKRIQTSWIRGLPSRFRAKVGVLSASMVLAYACLQSTVYGENIPMNSIQIKSANTSNTTMAEEDAKTIADKYLGISSGQKYASNASQVTNTDVVTPFLAPKLTGRPAWAVTYTFLPSQVAMELKTSIKPGPMICTVMLDIKSRELLSIKCTLTGAMTEVKDEPPTALATKQLENDGEMYAGVPSTPPRVSFLAALRSLDKESVASPTQAKEITASYITYSRNVAKSLPVWVITLRGIPPLRPHGKGAESVPVSQRNRLRSVVDAETGKTLFSTNTPHPE
jgi:hypothetical protein